MEEVKDDRKRAARLATKQSRCASKVESAVGVPYMQYSFFWDTISQPRS